MDTSTTSVEGAAKKTALEDLSREELIKKCRSLLTIAQKAKHARDALIEENNKLKQASPSDATEELIQSFTQQKLDLVTKNDKLLSEQKLLEEHNAVLQGELNVAEDKVASLDTECQGYRRQVARVTEENEQLLTHLDGLEAQINELKRIGLEQQQQLLVLEQNNEMLANQTLATADGQSQVNELQQMLTVSLEEVKKLKEENQHLNETLSEKEANIISLNDTITNYNTNLQKYDESRALLLQKDEELTKQASVIDDLNTELHKNRALAEKLKRDINNTSKRFNDNQIESSGINAELQNCNEKLREKLKFYHSKIVKLAGDVKKVKESKEYILDTFKVYNRQVQIWKEQLTTVSLRMKEEMDANLEEKNKLLKQIVELGGKLDEQTEGVSKDDVVRKLKEELNEMRNVMSENDNLHKTVDVMRSQIANYEVQIKNLQDFSLDKEQLLQEQSSSECKQLQEELLNEKQKCVKLQDELIELQSSCTNLRANEQLLELKTVAFDKLTADFSIKSRECDELIKELQDNAKLIGDLQEKLNVQNESLSNLREDLININSVMNEKAKEFEEVKIQKDLLENEKSTWAKEKTRLEDSLNTLHAEKVTWDKLKADFSTKKIECEELSKELQKLKVENDRLMKTGDENANLVVDLQEKLNAPNESLSKLQEELVRVNSIMNEKAKEFDEMKIQKDALENEKSRFDAEKVTWENSKSQYEATIEGNTRLVSELKKAIERLESDVESSRVTESKLAEQTSETILQLRQENKSLEDKVDDVRRQLEAAQLSGSAASLKSENAELLAEMNVMNQALKERGETISQQQAHCEELVKKIQVYESQLAKSQENVQQLQDEVQSLRSQGQQDESDALSTSTISRSDEVNRMKELEGSWEERYGKLRAYAVKLKAKARELQDDLRRVDGEKCELQGRVAGNVKTVQGMQAQIDALQDKLDAQKEGKGKLDQVSKDNQRLLQQLASNEETIRQLRAHADALGQEKVNLDAWKKQVGTKVQALKKELEANALMRKDFEARVQKLQAELAAKEKELAAEREKHDSTKSQLHESNNECKKQSVLNLEMQDYERSIKELAAKLEKKNEQVTKLKNQIDAQKSSVSATKEQHRLIDEKCKDLETELDACRIEIRTFKKQIADLEIVIGDKESKIDEVRKSLEGTRSENEDLSTQLSKIIAEHQKVNQMLRDEKDHFRNENVELESRVRQLEDQLKLRSDELANVNSEYQSYKVRAQSVLRQNQSRDVGVEEKLTEEAASLRAQMRIYQSEIEELKSKQKSLEAANQKLTEERVQLEAQQKDIQLELGSAQGEIEKLNAKHLQTIQEHNETVRSLKLHTETLSQCYRQQISEQEVRHNREVIELQSKYDKNPAQQPDIPSLIIPTSVREEGEGSESVDSNNGNVIHPLEKLLAADQDQELAAVKKQLNENELRVVHLTALLADTEQDLSKHMQMNKVLKEEIRRQQRSVERERHAENLEYMKNVVFKFITLTSGDERLRLVPVLNTILKLSPEETNKLNMVAKGDKSWSTYLPMWSGAGGSKPQ